MEFLTWLKKQNKRTDDIGFVSRLVMSSTESQDEMRKSASIKTYVESLPKGKIKIALNKGMQEWMGATKVAGRPQIGVFWIINGEVVPFLEDANTVQVVGGFKDSQYDHYSMWDKVAKAFPNLRGHGYEEVPRGRVIGVGADKYRIFLSPIDARNKTLVNRVMGMFSLPFGKTEVMTDAHYITQKHQPLHEVDEDYDPFEEKEQGRDGWTE